MKIFIGGLQRHHQAKFREKYPDVEFVFASFQESYGVWERRARGADFVIIDQSRTTHKIMEHMAKGVKVPVYYTDSKVRMNNIVKELIEHGTASHSYVHA